MIFLSAPVAMALLILVPLGAAIVAFAAPALGRRLGFAVAAASAAGSLELARAVLATGIASHSVGGWGTPLGIGLRADGLSCLLLLVTAGVGLAVTCYAQRYFDPASETQAAEAGHQQAYFWPLLFFLWASLDALLLSADIFNLYVTLELLGFSAVMLVSLAGKPAAVRAAMRYLLVSLTGSLCYLLGVGLVYASCSTVDLAQLAGRLSPGPASYAALVLMTGGLLAKNALFPLHFWLPSAHSNAPAPVSALLSALVVKGAFYILLRLWFGPFAQLIAPAATQMLGGLGAAAICYGSYQALRQPRLKVLVAYSTVAQLGYLFLVFPLAAAGAAGFSAWSGALVFLAAHACAKTAMFLTAGNILHAAGHDRIRDLAGITHVLPVSVFAFALSGMSLVGLPPSSGFMGKWLLIQAGLRQGQWWWVAVVLVGSLLAAAYVMRVLAQAFTRVPQTTAPNPIPPVMEWTALTLALLAVALGFAAGWPVGLLQVGAPLPETTLSGVAWP